MKKLITNDKFIRSWKTVVSRIISCNLFDRPFSSRIKRLWIHGGIAILAFLLSNDHNISIKRLRLISNLHCEPSTVHFNWTIFPCSFVIVFTNYSIIFLHPDPQDGILFIVFPIQVLKRSLMIVFIFLFLYIPDKNNHIKNYQFYVL